MNKTNNENKNPVKVNDRKAARKNQQVDSVKICISRYGDGYPTVITRDKA